MSLSYDHMPYDWQRGSKLQLQITRREGWETILSSGSPGGIFGWHSDWEEGANIFQQVGARGAKRSVVGGEQEAVLNGELCHPKCQQCPVEKHFQRCYLSNHHRTNYFRHICQMLPEIIKYSFASDGLTVCMPTYLNRLLIFPCLLWHRIIMVVGNGRVIIISGSKTIYMLFLFPCA